MQLFPFIIMAACFVASGVMAWRLWFYWSDTKTKGRVIGIWSITALILIGTTVALVA